MQVNNDQMNRWRIRGGGPTESSSLEESEESDDDDSEDVESDEEDDLPDEETDLNSVEVLEATSTETTVSKHQTGRERTGPCKGGSIVSRGNLGATVIMGRSTIDEGRAETSVVRG